ncbi:hypothetical protein WR25_08687 [Diploscapter pachys]|nr:hypothetical protein WR25_08687 [Diploscapter pachys]
MFKVNKPDCMHKNDKLGCICEVCKDVVAFTRLMILDHAASEEQILDKVCVKIFGYDKEKENMCESIIKAELPEIIKYVKARVDPKKTCAKFC